METIQRRRFLATCLGAVGAAAAAAVLYPVYRYLAPVRTDAGQQKVTFAETEIPPDGARFFDFRGATGVVIRKKGGELAAFSAICTHLGCVIQWEKDKQGFLCPCHAGRYSADGAVISGPPPRPLAKLAFTVANGTVTVG
jgi:cytochrome b6-f complex iron-sulfur subunit